MKRILASILLMALVVSQAHAAPAGKGQGRGQGPGMNANGPRMSQMQQNLGLTQEQVEQMQAVREQGGGRADVEAILTQEQLQQLEQQRAERRTENPNAGSRPKDGRGRTQGPGRGPGTYGPEPDDSSG